MRFAFILLLPALVAGRAATASNAVPAGPAGAGAAAISGYTISEVSYSLAGDTLDGVSFRLTPPGAKTVRARLAPSEPWSECTLDGETASCPVATSPAEATSLDVVAAG